MSDEWLNQAEAAITKVLQEARPELLAAHGNVEEEVKSDNSPVTMLDRKLEQQLREALMQFDASIPVVGEEYGGEASGTYWLVDPIDGTESFIRGLPFFQNLVALIHDNEPVFALVHKPLIGDVYTARKGQGALKNGQAIQASTRPLSQSIVDILAGEYTGQLLQALSGKIKGFKRINELVYVAEGKIDAMISCSDRSGPWDNAPRMLLLQEAGLKVANIGSKSFDFTNGYYIAANPAIFDELMSMAANVVVRTETTS